MTVPFSRVPGNLRVPLFYVEFDNSMANTATATQRTLLIGQMLASGSAQEKIPVKVSSPNAVGELTGKGSMLHGMMTAYQKSKRLVRTVLIFTESSDQLSRATDRVPGLPASPGYVQ